MSTIQAPFDALPADGKTYRLYWAGQVVPRAFDSGTPRIAMWFSEVPAAPTTTAVLVWESCGSVPSMPIGSYWRDQIRVEDPSPGGAETKELDLTLRAVNEWQPVQAGAKWQVQGDADPRPHRWINPSDYVLSLSDQHRRRVPCFDAYVVPAYAIDGTEVIIPCYEIFRTYYAGTSDLATKLLTEPWEANAIAKMVSSSAVSGNPIGSEWTLALSCDMTEVGIRYLARLVLDRETRREASLIYPNLVYRRQFELEDPWIRVSPPARGRQLKFRARVRHLPSRKALLVEEILTANYPVDVASIQVTIPRETVVFPAGSDPDSAEGASEAKPPGTMFRIGPAGDRRTGLRLTNLAAASPIWVSAPKIRKSAITRRYVAKANEQEGVAASATSTVSVGADGHSTAPKRASLSAQTAQDMHDRFAALLTTLRAMERSGQIAGWESIAIVNPFPPQSPRYCAFPQAPANRPRGWASINRPQQRPRMAWVIALKAPSSLHYWIESEASTTSDVRCSMCFRMLQAPTLTESVLRRLLSLCVEKKGAWPVSPPPPLASEVAWVRVRHQFQGHQLSASAIIKAIKKLESPTGPSTKIGASPR